MFRFLFSAFSQGATPSQVHKQPPPPPPPTQSPALTSPPPHCPYLSFPFSLRQLRKKPLIVASQRDSWEEVWSLLTHVTGLKHPLVHHVRWLQRISLHEKCFHRENMKKPKRNASAGMTGCSGRFWFLLSINVKSLMVIKTPCSLLTSPPSLCLIIDYSSRFFLKVLQLRGVSMRSSAVTNGRPLTYILKFKPGQQQPCSKESLAGGLLQDGGTEKLQTADECRNRGKCGWKGNKKEQKPSHP